MEMQPLDTLRKRIANLLGCSSESGAGNSRIVYVCLDYRTHGIDPQSGADTLVGMRGAILLHILAKPLPLRE